MDIKTFVNLTSRAWALPILASLHAGVAARQAPLLTATGAGRTAFGQSLTHLIDLGLVERNPGYGHPLRPEFRLTPRGQAAAALAHRIVGVASEEDQAVLRRSWTLPVLATLHQPSHFNDIKARLQTITDRALSQTLKVLEDHTWVRRSVDVAARPPRPDYRAVNTGQVIAKILIAELRFDR